MEDGKGPATDRLARDDDQMLFREIEGDSGTPPRIVRYIKPVSPASGDSGRPAMNSTGTQITPGSPGPSLVRRRPPRWRYTHPTRQFCLRPLIGTSTGPPFSLTHLLFHPVQPAEGPTCGKSPVHFQSFGASHPRYLFWMTLTVSRRKKNKTEGLLRPFRFPRFFWRPLIKNTLIRNGQRPPSVPPCGPFHSMRLRLMDGTDGRELKGVETGLFLR